MLRTLIACEMQMRRLPAFFLAAVAALCAATAHAQFPSRPVRFIVPYSPGGALDTTLRLIGDQMSTALKQPVVIESRPGGSTTIGTQVMAQAPADGHTLFVNAASFTINPHLMPKLPYDTWKDFVPVTLMTANAHVLTVSPSLNAPNLKAFVGAARAKPGGLSYASFGNGSSSHLAFELLKNAYGFDMLHVPYKGAPPALLDVMSGTVHAMLNDLPVAAPYVKSGKVAGLAIAADKRSPVLPDVPTFQEAGGIAFASRSWFGMIVRAETPPDLVKQLNAAIVAALRTPEVREKLTAVGTEIFATSPDEFGAFMRTESARYAAAIKAAGVKLDQ